MKRTQVEEVSKIITQKYIKMQNEMVRSQACEPIECDSELRKFYYIKINERPRLEQISQNDNVDNKILESFFKGMFSVGSPVSVVISSANGCVSVYIGTYAENIDMLDGVLKGTVPYIKYEVNSSKNIKIYDCNIARGYQFGGFIKGNPGLKREEKLSGIDSVIRGMGKKTWTVSVFAYPLPKAHTLMRQQYWLTEATNCSELSEVSYTDTDSIETISYKKSYYHSEQYLKKVEEFSSKLTESTTLGEWCVSVNYSSDTNANSDLLGGILASAFFKDDSVPEAVHSLKGIEGRIGPIANGEIFSHTEYCSAKYPKYSSYISSKELAVYADLPSVDTAGFSVVEGVDFDVNRDVVGDISLGRIIDSGLESDFEYSYDSNEFNRHCLTVGLTGGGKTNTLKSVLHTISKSRRLPFLVIEPAKKEYWELYKLGYEDLQIYSVGSNEDNAVTLCINPFERAVFIDENGVRKSVSIQTHIDFVYAAFKASFIMYTPMPYVLERAIYEIYEDCGWDIRNDTNKFGKEIYPTIEDLYFKIPQVVTAMGYDQRMRNDLIGSLGARINSLRIGSKGATLNVEKSYPIEKLLNGNTVVELEDIGDDDVKAFIISLLLVNLLEYRRQQTDSHKSIRHITLIEEAHRLLKNVQSSSGENADPRGAAVEFFCNLLAELRSKGQGFIVADQIPSKLAPDLIKNTNLKIVHRTVDKEERELVGGAMHMTDEQVESLCLLKQGVAAVYSEGDNRPKLVKFPYAGALVSDALKNLTREDVLARVVVNCIDYNQPYYKPLTDTKNEVCRRCNMHCDKKHTDILSCVDDVKNFESLSSWLNPVVAGSCKADKIREGICSFINQHICIADEDKKDATYCLLKCLLDDWQLNSTLEEKLIDKMFN